VEGPICSDHLPIVVTLHDEIKMGRGDRKFKHEAFWVFDGTYKEVIKVAWKAKAAQADQWGCLWKKLGN
jgi:hypothetical protein